MRFKFNFVFARFKSTSVGLVGLPNSGKSTIFNALAQRQLSFVGNFPFATIEPTSTLLAIPDARLRQLTALSRSAKETPCFVEIVDIAGLVRGASEGRGLGNAFLANIGAVQSILHVVRAFDDSSIEHVEGAVDPVRDLALIKEELALRDLSLLDHRAKARRAPPIEVEMARALIPVLEAGKDVLAFVDALLPEKRAVVNTFGLLSTKKSQVLLNVDEAGLRGNRHTEAFLRHSPATLICGKLEAEVADLDDAEAKAEMLASYGISSTAIEIVAQNTIDLLDAAVFYTTGDTESRAWLFKRGTIARECAGLIHTSFIKNFVRAEVRSFADALANKTARIEGPNYVMQNHDVVFFRISQ
jgi:GTP-binding protein YchF